MNKLKIMLVALVAFATLTSACKDDNSNTDAEVRYSFEVVKTSGQSKATQGLAETSSSHLRFTDGYITIREIVFDGDIVGGKSVSITHEQVAEIDVATGNTTPSLETIQIPAGTYTSVNLGIELQDVNDQPQVVIEGFYTDTSGSEVPLRFEFNSGEVFEANASEIQLTEDRVATAQIKFDPIFWFSTITTEEFEDAVRTNGVIIVSETSNADIFSTVADRLDVATQATFN